MAGAANLWSLVLLLAVAQAYQADETCQGNDCPSTVNTLLQIGGRSTNPLPSVTVATVSATPPSVSLAQKATKQQKDCSAGSDCANDFVTAHNFYRCMHGAPAVEWDDDVYQSGADYIKDKTEMIHSDCYNIPAPAGPAGENLFKSGGSQGSFPSPADAVKMWYDEVNNCDPDKTTFTDGCLNGTGTTGHFTAMIWSAVTKIGCAYSESFTGLVVCRYKAGDTLNSNTPNMMPEANYVNNVNHLSKTPEECLGMYPVPTPAPPPPPGACADVGSFCPAYGAQFCSQGISCSLVTMTFNGESKPLDQFCCASCQC